jgi:osmotically-inducible protein OsmY
MNMLRTFSAVVLGLAVSAGAAQASSVEPKNLQLFNAVAQAVNTYERYTIFDDVNIGAREGTVTLSGKVTSPLKREELEKRIAKIDGVQQLRDEISVLPLSPMDDQLRSRIARAIYGNENFWVYAQQIPGPIHIIVENGRVTLTGVVANDMDRMMAWSAANQFPAFSVTNNLKTDAEVRAELEKL